MERGYSLIELMVIITLIGIISSIAVINARSMGQSQDLKTAEATVTAAFSLAKQTALSNVRGLRSGATAAVCFHDDGAGVSVEATSVDGQSARCSSVNSSTQLTLYPFDMGVSVLDGNDDPVSCFCFNSKGRITQEGNCASCSSTAEVTFQSGSKEYGTTVF